MTAIRRYLLIQDGLSELVGRVISGLVLVMVGVLVYEVVMRYFLGSPTIWAHEFTTMVFGAFAILGASYTLREQAHVRSEVVWGAMPERLQAVCDMIVFTLGLAVLAVVFWQSIDFAQRSWETREFSNRSVWQPPLYYIKSLIPLAIALLMLQSVAEVVRAVAKVLNLPLDDPREVHLDEDDDDAPLTDSAARPDA